ncbi:NUDIX domain-containing protein [Salinicoccus halitifaciens]|uniref:NUDIX family phosphoesterase n=1 Tax=Salinicoccus halitifaciens TaxID=1073415 RepID=A0ABV2E618_9STAP|nr:NUDIX domain-containing protein [Salinicoccus halitifaciens]MCD2137072.1 NUDIX domain-containing protein [Salinicoccus halitifaciens]
MSKFDEQILVVPREELFNSEENAFNGFIGKNDGRYQPIVGTFNNFEVKRRGDMEEDPSYKQLISYVIISSEGGKETLVYERLGGGGEERLHGLLSIGVGGHMNDIEDADDIDEKLSINARRELEEEVGLSGDDIRNIEIMGLINDDDNEVGRVHIGLVLKVSVDKGSVSNMEADTLSLKWISNDDLPDLSPYESWSELIIRDAYGR